MIVKLAEAKWRIAAKKVIEKSRNFEPMLSTDKTFLSKMISNRNPETITSKFQNKLMTRAHDLTWKRGDVAEVVGERGKLSGIKVLLSPDKKSQALEALHKQNMSSSIRTFNDKHSKHGLLDNIQKSLKHQEFVEYW